jgi:microcystin-dependent protein
MADPFVAEIRIFPFNFPPKGWAFCDGQAMSITQNTALYTLLGLSYGGDGKATFALPNLDGAIPVHQGQGQGLTGRSLGESGGADTVTLLDTEMPVHNHGLMAADAQADVRAPAPNTALARSTGGNAYQDGPKGLVAMNFNSLPAAGASMPHNNLMPYLTLYFNIALQGVFPPRS